MYDCAHRAWGCGVCSVMCACGEGGGGPVCGVYRSMYVVWYACVVCVCGGVCEW